MTNKEIKAFFIQAELDRVHFTRDVINALFGTSYTTRHALLSCVQSSPWIVAHFMKKNLNKDKTN
jgi:hypothetical protein